MAESYLFSIVILLILAIFGFAKCITYAGKFGYINFVGLIRISFIVFYLISGVAHYYFIDNYYRGFFDVYSMRADHIYVPLVVFFSFIVLFYSQDFYSNRMLRKIHSANSDDNLIDGSSANNVLLWVGLFFSMIGFIASGVISSSIDVSTIERGREIPGGLAKFIFVSLWFSWGVTFISIYLLRSGKFYFSKLFFILGFSVLIIASNAMWLGGRAVVVILCFPLIFSYAIFNRRVVYAALPILLTLFFGYVLWVTDVRKEGYAVEATSLSQILDWELGRFSMVGYAIDFVDRFSFTYGLPYFDALAKLLFSPVYFSGLGADFVGRPEGSTIYIIGVDLLGGGGTYIVPGAVPEMYLNFGVFGVFVLSLGLGFFSVFIDKCIKISATSDIYGLIFWSYLGTLLCLNFLNATFASFLSYIFFTGFPLTFLFFVTRIFSRKKRWSPK